MDSTYFGPAESASAYINEVSYGKTWLEGEVFDNDGAWYTLDMDYPDACFVNETTELLFEAVNEDIDWFDDAGEQEL